MHRQVRNLRFGQRAVKHHSIQVGGYLPDSISQQENVFQCVKTGLVRRSQFPGAVAPGAMLGMSLYRVGCILSGCCYGLPSTSTCSVRYVNPDSFAPTNIAIYPTQVYHLVLGLLAFVILWILRNRLKPEGALFLLWLALFSAGDLAVRFFRVANPFIFNWQLAQMVDIAILAVTIPWFMVKIQSHRTNQQYQLE